MAKNVFFPQYAKTGSVETLTTYSIGDKNYNVYLVTIDNENKFVHDEREKGALEFVTIEDVNRSMESIDNQIRELSNQINKLRRAKEQNQYIINVLKNNVSSNEAKPSDSEKKSFTNEAKPFNTEAKPSNLGTNPSDNGMKFSGQPNFQNKKSCNKEQPTKKFIISTPLGLVADVDDEGVTFTVDVRKTKTFDDKGKGIRFAREIFENQLPFRVEPIVFNRGYNNHKCHCSDEGDLFGLLSQIFSGGHPSKENLERLKGLFPGAEIKGFSIDENGHVTEL